MATSLTTLETRIQNLLPELERVYTDIHAHPELSMQETRTAACRGRSVARRRIRRDRRHRPDRSRRAPA